MLSKAGNLTSTTADNSDSIEAAWRKEHNQFEWFKCCGYTVWAPRMWGKGTGPDPGSHMCAAWLYVVAALISLAGVVVGIADAAEILRSGQKPTVSTIVMKWLITLSFLIKAPYLTTKLLSMMTVGILVFGFGTIAVVDTVAFVRNSEHNSTAT